MRKDNITTGESDETSLECHGNRTFHNVSLTAFYPSLDSEEDEEDYDDARGDKLRTLQVYTYYLYWKGLEYKVFIYRIF